MGAGEKKDANSSAGAEGGATFTTGVSRTSSGGVLDGEATSNAGNLALDKPEDGRSDAPPAAQTMDDRLVRGQSVMAMRQRAKRNAFAQEEMEGMVSEGPNIVSCAEMLRCKTTGACI